MLDSAFVRGAIGSTADALVAMRFLGREGDGPQAKYFNTPEGSLFLDEASRAIDRSAAATRQIA